jgi:hypothetical protein
MTIFFISHYVLNAPHNSILEISRQAPFISIVQYLYDCVNQHLLESAQYTYPQHHIYIFISLHYIVFTYS